MSGQAGPSSMLSPTSPRTAKAGLFRARSPPVEQSFQPASFDLNTRIDPFGVSSSNGRFTPGSSNEGHSLLPPGRAARSTEGGYASSAGASVGHTPHLPHTTRVERPSSPPSSDNISPIGPTAGTNGGFNAPNRVDEDTAEERESSYENGIMGLAGRSDEMLMTLLAGQAAVDCEQLPIGGWEEVESWKKELTLLSTRVESLIARHQREIKILTAARTLQKLNNANKRMSRQTMESLEQAEKKADAAEKELLVLRDREASLRRRLMEHWSGVMAWEVRRLERVSSEAQRQSRRAADRANASKAREEEIARRATTMAAELQRSSGRITELEEMVVEMGRRERAIEEEVAELEEVKARLEEEKASWTQSRGDADDKHAEWERERQIFAQERQAWAEEKRTLIQDREAVVKARALERAKGQMSENDRAMVERVRMGIGSILGRKGGVVEDQLAEAVEDVRKLLQTREDEVVRLKEEVREINSGLEEEVKRATTDRDMWKNKVESAERGDSSRNNDMLMLEKRLRAQNDQISDLSLRNESLAASLQAAQAAVSQQASSSESVKSLQNKVEALTAELDSIAGQFNEVWRILPSNSRRLQAELVDPQTGRSNTSLKSPSTAVNFAALQQVFTPHEEGFSGIDEMLNRVRGLVDDGKVLVDRVCRLGQERELLKQNAGRAKKLAEDSRASLETYQRQVAVLEDRLAKTGATESKFLEELNSLRSALDAASASKRQLEASAHRANETCDRLTSANDMLSAKVLSLAEDTDIERKHLSKKWQEEMDELKKRLVEAQEEVDEAKTRGQAQRIQLLDELNSLQAENGDLRKQLRGVRKQ